MLKFIAAIFVACFTCSAVAQDISIKMKEIPAGSWYLADSGNGSVIHVFGGKTGKHYIYDVIRGKDPNGPRVYRDLRDASGNTTKRVYAGGRTVTFTPHSCRRVVGQCSFVERGEKFDGTSYKTKMVRVNTPKGRGYTIYQVAIADNGEQIPIRSGSAQSLDSKGMVVKGRLKSLTTGQSENFRKLRASWD